MLPDLAEILDGLQPQEQQPAHRGQEQVEACRFGIPFFAGVDRPGHEQTAGDQDKGIDPRDKNVGLRNDSLDRGDLRPEDPPDRLKGSLDAFRETLQGMRGRELRMRVAHDDIHREESREEHDLGTDEQPHPERDLFQPFFGFNFDDAVCHGILPFI